MQGRQPGLTDLPGRGAVLGQFSDEIGEVVIADSWVAIRRGMVRAVAPAHPSQLPRPIAIYLVLSRPNGSGYRPAEVSPLRPQHHRGGCLLSYCHLLREIRCSPRQLLLLPRSHLLGYSASYVRKSRDRLISTRTRDSLRSHPKLPRLFRKGLRLLSCELSLPSILIRTRMIDDGSVLYGSAFGELHDSIGNAKGELIMVCVRCRHFILGDEGRLSV
jgi:hypothetical protein